MKFLSSKLGKMREFKGNSSADIKVLNEIESKQDIFVVPDFTRKILATIVAAGGCT
jgi:hypothetical protein